MTEQRLGILGGMGRPTRLAPCGDPGDLICSGQMNCPGIKVLAFGQNTCTAQKRRGPEVRFSEMLYLFRMHMPKSRLSAAAESLLFV